MLYNRNSILEATQHQGTDRLLLIGVNCNCTMIERDKHPPCSILHDYWKDASNVRSKKEPQIL